MVFVQHILLLPMDFAQPVHTASLLSSSVNLNAGLEINVVQFYAKKVWAAYE